MDQSSDVTQLLQRIERGETAATDRLLTIVYEQLRSLARQKLAREQPGQTLQATALVHEAWVRLVDDKSQPSWQNRRHFFGAAAEAMRRILVDTARRKNRHKHGGDFQRIDVDTDELPGITVDEHCEAVNDALDRFATVDAEACELVTLRYFAGLSQKDAAAVLGLASRTADRLWAYAKAWLSREIGEPSEI